MDVSSIIEAEKSKQKSVTVEKEIPLEVDAGLLAVTDLNPLDVEAYEENREEFLKLTARDGVQALVASLFSLPVQSSADGPLAMIPQATTQLPRSKPLPKPKPPTKWEKFAAAKGIQKITRDKKVFDEEKQEWVNRWGKGGKNREAEEQWLTEIPDNAEPDFDPAKTARDERKARFAKNEKQRQRNVERSARPAQGSSSSGTLGDRKRQIEKTLATTRVSTASMGKFDKKLDGESKPRGIKRKFQANETSADAERKTSLAIASKLDGSSKRPKRSGEGGDEILNVRKAIRYVTKGRGATALASKRGSGKVKAGKAGKGKAKR